MRQHCSYARATGVMTMIPGTLDPSLQSGVTCWDNYCRGKSSIVDIFHKIGSSTADCNTVTPAYARVTVLAALNNPVSRQIPLWLWFRIYFYSVHVIPKEPFGVAQDKLRD